MKYELLGTLSGGYDSPAVMTLARSSGCRTALYFKPDRPSADSAAPAIAEKLGIKLETIAVSEWRQRALSEVAFIAGTPDAEDIRFAGATDHLRWKVLVSGTWGDNPWTPTEKPIQAYFERTDTQGLSLCEFRLWVGLQNCAVPFWGGLEIDAIRGLGRSREMEPWNLSSGYNRPICRRILEEAGLERGSFAYAKVGQSPNLYMRSEFMTEASKEEYGDWLRRNRLWWYKRGRIPPVANWKYDGLCCGVRRKATSMTSRLPYVWRIRPLETPTYMRRFVFPWAVETTSTKYRQALERSGVAVIVSRLLGTSSM